MPFLASDRLTERRLLMLSALFTATAFYALQLAPAVRAADWDVFTLQPSYWASFGIWAACALITHVVLDVVLPDRDKLMVPIVFLLNGWSLALIWRLAGTFGMRQSLWLAIATTALLIVVSTPKVLRTFQRYRYLWMITGILLTALPLFIGVNPSGFGAELWLGCCGVYFQPSELLKLVLVVYLATYLSHNAQHLNGAKSVPLIGSNPLALFVPMLVIWGFSLLLLLNQRDLGTGSLLFALFVLLLYQATENYWYLVVGALLLILGGFITYQLFDVVQVRVNAWLNPWLDASGNSYQIAQSLLALAAGGFAGRGFGIGAPRVIPVVHSDFIYAAVVEEWGLLGGFAMLALFGILLARIFRTSILAPNKFRSLLAGGVAIVFGLQMIFIVGGVIKALPLTGVTFPFVSYGGSALLINFIMLGLVLRISAARHNP